MTTTDTFYNDRDLEARKRAGELIEGAILGRFARIVIWPRVDWIQPPKIAGEGFEPPTFGLLDA